jgi:hypothetical protein
MITLNKTLKGTGRTLMSAGKCTGKTLKILGKEVALWVVIDSIIAVMAVILKLILDAWD